MRAAVAEKGIPVIVYEAGEALRFDELAIRAGLRGVLDSMRALGMLPATRSKGRRVEPFVAHGSAWVRAPDSGVLSTQLALGTRVEKDQVLAQVSDPLGEEETPVLSATDGVLIGRTNLPLVNEGDALFHIAAFKRLDPAAEEIDFFQEDLAPND